MKDLLATSPVPAHVLLLLLAAGACGGEDAQVPAPNDAGEEAADDSGSEPESAAGDADAVDGDGTDVVTDPCAALDCEAEGRLCEDGACVDPWRFGSPVFGTCPDDPKATPETLAEKAAIYDERAMRLHVHPGLGFIQNAQLAPGTSDLDATWEDVVQWHSGENDGLWNGLYLASQAFRYAATGSEEALDNVRFLLEGEVTRMAITGVPGVFTRQYVPPGIAGIGCPGNPEDYVPDVEKDDNQWVKIGEDGCIHVADPETLEFVATGHCGHDGFEGWCFLDNVSQDEYGGHMMALAALLRLVPDPDVQATTRDLLEQIGVHLMENDLTFVDWDGRVTEHGKLYVTSFADTPGFLAAESLAFFRLAIEATGREDLESFYRECLLQENGLGPCLDHPLEQGDPYTDWLPAMGMYVGEEGCKTNYNNLSMVMTWLFDLLWVPWDPEVRGLAQAVMDTEIMRAEVSRAAITQKNAWFNVIFAALKDLGPGSDGPAYEAVEDAICSLKQFPASKAQTALDPGLVQPHDCEGRLGDSQAALPYDVADRCTGTFLWWRSPYDRDPCGADPTYVRQPADYLLAYWMGRYFGFVPADL